MADIVHYLTINAPVVSVFPLVSTPRGLNLWWTRDCKGIIEKGGVYHLDFGSDFQWEAVVNEIQSPSVFELQITKADDDWIHSVLRFELSGDQGATSLRFFHTGWPHDNEHRRISNYCWAMYLRLLKQNVETGLFVPYEKRLEV